MIVIGILMLFMMFFLIICACGATQGIRKELERHNKRMDEIIKVLKK